MIYQLAILLSITCIYMVITKNNFIKYKIKIYIRRHYITDTNAVWTRLVSCAYCLLPFLTLCFIPKVFYSKFIFVKATQSFILLLAEGIVGMCASLTLTTIVLNIVHYIYKVNYNEMNDVPWIKQVKKVNFLWGVLAAASEEFFIRLLIPIEIFIMTNDNLLLIFSLIISSLIFIILQVTYTNTKIQRLTKGVGALSISIASIFLFLGTLNIIPSIIMHVIYVFLFLMNRKSEKEKYKI